jgi:hypothetical protein
LFVSDDFLSNLAGHPAFRSAKAKIAAVNPDLSANLGEFPKHAPCCISSEIRVHGGSSHPGGFDD